MGGRPRQFNRREVGEPTLRDRTWQPPGGASSSWTTLLAAGLILAAGLAAYANSFRGPFIYDDVRVISDNPRVRHIWPPWAPLWDVSRPVGMWSFALNYALGGQDVRGYHATNLAIHLATGLVLFGLARRTFRRGRLAARFGSAATGLALVIALVWTVHPLQTQAVTYTVQRLESLMGLFYLLTVYAFVRAHDSRRPAAWYAASVLFCALGMGVKEVMATAPLLVLWYDRAFIADSWRDVGRRWKYYVPLAGTWMILAFLMFARRDEYLSGEVVVVENLSLWRYAATQPGVILHYLKLSVWPQVLCLDYGWPAAHGFRAIVPPLAAIAVLLALTAWFAVRQPAWGFLGGWFLVILSVTSSFVPIRDLAYEHRMYLSLAAVVAAVVAGGYALGGRLRNRWPAAARLVGWATVMVVVAALAFRTAQRNADYRTAVMIWDANVAAQPGNARAHNNLGLALAEEGRLDAAMDHYRKALEIRPDYLEPLNNLGNALALLGRNDEAIAQFRKTLEIKADFPEGHADLGNMLLSRGQVDEAILHYRKALEAKPGLARVHYNLGNALVDRGQHDEAIAEYRKATELKPDLVEAYSNLGNQLAALGQIDAAIAEYRKALAIQPNAPAATNLANVLCARGQVDEGISYYRQAIEIKPDLVEAHFNLALALANRGQIDEALAHYQKALALATAGNNLPLADAIRGRIQSLRPAAAAAP